MSLESELKKNTAQLDRLNANLESGKLGGMGNGPAVATPAPTAAAPTAPPAPPAAPPAPPVVAPPAPAAAPAAPAALPTAAPEVAPGVSTDTVRNLATEKAAAGKTTMEQVKGYLNQLGGESLKVANAQQLITLHQWLSSLV